MESSEPVNLCQQCVKKYRESEQAYANISLFLDDNNVSCAAHYLNLDKLNILETVHLNSVNLWVAANCDACFAGNNTISEFGQKFLNLSDLMNDCLVTAKDKCQDCEKSYLMLNELYEREKKFNKLCFDLEDIVRTGFKF